MSTSKRKNNKYSPELKLEAVKREMAGESVLIIASNYGIPKKLIPHSRFYLSFNQVASISGKKQLTPSMSRRTKGGS